MLWHFMEPQNTSDLSGGVKLFSLFLIWGFLFFFLTSVCYKLPIYQSTIQQYFVKSVCVFFFLFQQEHTKQLLFMIESNEIVQERGNTYKQTIIDLKLTMTIMESIISHASKRKALNFTACPSSRFKFPSSFKYLALKLIQALRQRLILRLSSYS